MSQPKSQLSPPGIGSQQRRAGSRIPRPLFWIVLFAFFIPYGVTQIPREIGRWHLASAIELREKGETESAYDELEAAVYWFPNSPELLLQRAEWKLADGKREEALADCDAMLAAKNDSYASAEERSQWLSIHASFLQHAGNFVTAVEDWKNIEQLSQRSGIPNRATALNGIAYAQSLTKTDLDEALSNVNEALKLARGNPNILDTRGYIHFLRDDYDAALTDLDLAVAGLDKEVEVADEIAKRDSMPQLYRKVVNSKPKRLLEFDPPHDAATRRALIGAASAVVHYHRFLVLDALDRKDEAKKDWEIARQLIGREPDETLF